MSLRPSEASLGFLASGTQRIRRIRCLISRAEGGRTLAQELEAAHSPVTLLEVPGLKHRAILLQLSPLWSPGGKVRDQVIRFLDERSAVTQ
jgi:hypothetical protein